MHTPLTEIVLHVRQNVALSMLLLIQTVPSTEISTFKGRESQVDSNVKRS